MLKLICLHFFSLFLLVPQELNYLNTPNPTPAPGNTTGSVGIWNEALFSQHPEPQRRIDPVLVQLMEFNDGFQ